MYTSLWTVGMAVAMAQRQMLLLLDRPSLRIRTLNDPPRQLVLAGMDTVYEFL
jgi:hypothetical protein